MKHILTGILAGLIAFAPACTLAEVNTWRAAKQLPALEADDPATPGHVETATAWWDNQPPPPPVVPLTTRDVISFAAEQERPGWGRNGPQRTCLLTVVDRETGGTFNPTAKSPRSTAYGLFQFLDSTWSGTGVGRTSDPWDQTVAGVRYIRSRYGTPCDALSFHRRNGFY